MFFTSKIDARLDRMDASVRESFEKVRADVGRLGQWVKYFQAQNDQQQRVIRALQVAVRDQVTAGSVDRLIDAKLGQQGAKVSRNPEYERRLGVLEARQDEHVKRMMGVESGLASVKELLNARVQSSSVEPKVRVNNLREKIARNVGRQSKEYIKRVILNVCAKYENITATSLREIVVDEQKLCSRSSFYRLVDELVDEEKLSAISSGKERTLVANRKLFKD